MSYLVFTFVLKHLVNGVADWCHAVIGHLESCDENENTCHCRYSGEKSLYLYMRNLGFFSWVSF